MDTAKTIILFCFLLQGVCGRDFSISLPEKIQPLSGSCVIIKCRFDINETYDKDLTDTAIGVWFKDGTDVNNNLVFNSSRSVQNSGIKGEITGKLKDKDCTTVFTDIRSNHSGQYFFRIEGEGGLKYNYKESSVSINVTDAPKSDGNPCSNGTHGSRMNQIICVGCGVFFSTVLIGIFVFSLVVVILCAMTCVYIRKFQWYHLQAAQELSKMSDQDADEKKKEAESDYEMMSSVKANVETKPTESKSQSEEEPVEDVCDLYAKVKR